VKHISRLVIALLGLAYTMTAHAEATWNAQDYDLYGGDFNGDGNTDILFIAKDPSKPSGIALSDGTAPTIIWQTWASNFLGIPWSGNAYNVVVADFDGDGRSDIFLQRAIPGDHYLLLTDTSARIVGISQAIPNGAMGLDWSADQHRVVAGDFNSDGKADLFLQSATADGLNAIVLADSNGQFTATTPAQTWTDGYLGFKWSTKGALVSAGDFNGDGRSDLLLQAYPAYVTSGGKGPVAQYSPNSNGVVFAAPSTNIFALAGVQAWSRTAYGVDWSPLSTTPVVADFNGDARSDVLLQPNTSPGTSYLLYGNATGSVFGNGVALDSGINAAADTVRLIPGYFAGRRKVQLYVQALRPMGASYIGTVDGASMTAEPAPAAVGGLAVQSDGPGAAMAATLSAPVTPTAVGRTVGDFAVSRTGSATYSIPIAVPPGVAAIQPSLAIVYQSGGDDGLLGVGWNLSGLSQIGRCKRTVAQDGINGAVTMTAADFFCLDGNRLRMTSGTTYGAANTTYQTELEQFSKVTSYGVAGTGPSYFILQGKNGLTYEYGRTTDSRIESTASGYTTTARVWLLNKVTDRDGNAMTFTYLEDGAAGNGSYRPSQVDYTSNSTAGLTAVYRVKFFWDTRPASDNPTQYVAGGKVIETYRLNHVEAQYNDPSVGNYRLVRSYNLTYGTSAVSPRSRITAIQECDRNGACLPATTIGWQDGVAGLSNTSTAIGIPVLSAPMRADFDGDGRDDVLYYQPAGGSGSYVVKFATASGGYGTAVDTGLTSTPLLIGNLLGNGPAGIMVDQGGVWWYYSYNGASFSAASTGVAVDPSSNSALADTNGDGLLDLVTLRTDGWVYVRLNNGGGIAPSFSATASQAYNFGVSPADGRAGVWSNPRPSFSRAGALDFDGDGRQDIVAWKTVTILVEGFPEDRDRYSLLLSNDTVFTKTATYPDGDAIFGFANVNGDPCTDLVFLTYVLTSKCSDTLSTTVTFGTNHAPLAAMDWNGDGLTDIVVDNGSTLGVYKSQGGSFSTLMTTSVQRDYYDIVCDQDGDGLDDLVSAQYGGSPYTYRLHNGVALLPDLVTSITDGFGNSIGLSYAPLTDSSFYTKGTTAIYPERDVMLPAYAVKQVTSSNGLAGTYTVSQTYAGARFNVGGRGFEGFATRSETDSRSGITSTTTFNQLFPFTGTPASTTVRQPNGKSISQSTSHYTDLVTGSTQYNDRHFPYADSTTQTAYEVNASDASVDGLGVSQLSTSATVDSYGTTQSVTESTYDMTSGSAVLARTVATTATLNNDTTNWCLGFVTQQQVTNTVPGQTAQTRTVQFVKDPAAPAKCRPSQKIVEPSSAWTVTTAYAYDTFGHINTETVSATGITNRVTSTSYGTKGVFPISVTNAESETTTSTFDYALGAPLSKTDPNGIAVSWTYDGFGRKTGENRADGTYTTWTLYSCDGTNAYCGDNLLRYQVQEQQYTAGGGQLRLAVQMFDSLARAKYAQAPTVSGTVSNVATSYDALGRAVSRSRPYVSGGAMYNTTTSFDLIGRPLSESRQVSETDSTTQTVSYSYKGSLQTFTDAAGRLTQKQVNALGQTVQVTDPMTGITQYQYDPFGNPSKVIDPLGNQIVTNYNVRGFKMSMSDPDMGSWTYDYFPTGELKTQTDAKGQVGNYTYDRVARPKTRIEPEGTTTWTYGASAASHNVGRLVSVTSPGGYAEAYTFDGFGRPSNVTTTIDGTGYVVTSAYDSLTGLLDSVTYPTSTNAVTNSRFKAQYLYAYGQLQTVRDAYTPSTVYWQANSTDAAGHVIDEQLGNGLHSYSAFDAVDGLLRSRVTGAAGLVQNLAYNWDKVGNLTHREDLNQNLAEDFTMDNLNRLTDSRLTVGSTQTTNLHLVYDATGNITSKSDVGTYLYPTSGVGSIRPHAVSSAGGQSYSYDGNGNMTGGAGKTMTWFSYNLPNLITKGTSSSQFFYGAGRGRYKQIAIAGAGGSLPAGTETTLYVGGLFEKVTKPSGVVEYKHYISAGGDPVAMRTLRTNSINDTRYLHKDHLGSVDTITDEFGAVVLRLSFDAFGKRRGSAWSGSPSSGDWTQIASTTHRGFTYHEQLDTVDLVHMNGRVYDPTLGRFISADPTVQAPFMSQSLNRYSYVLNNPLSMIDPSGFNWLSSAWHSIKHFFSKYWKVIAAIVVSVVTFGTLAPLASAWLATACLVEGTITVGGAMVAGAVAGALAGGIMGGWKGALVGAVSGALFGASNVAWGQVGNSFGRAVGQAATSGTIGGVSSEALGGSFRVGFWTGFAASAAYNIYKAVADNYDPTWKPGDEVVAKDPDGSQATPETQNIGLSRPPTAPPLTVWQKWIPWYEGNYWFRALNCIPGANSFATFHDWLSHYFKPTWLFVVADVPSMAPALAINYAGLMNGPQLLPVLADEASH
jgi:RHS repeat-associated protein